MSLPRPGRLALLIYLTSLATLVLFLGFLLTLRQVLKPQVEHELQAPARYVARQLERHLDDPPELLREARFVQESMRLVPGVFRSDGTPLLPPGPDRPAPLEPAQLLRLEAERSISFGLPPRVVVALPAQGPMRAYVVLPFSPPPILDHVTMVGLFLALLALLAVFAARALVRPLERLAATARALGAGDLDARVNFTRRDELGAVGHAFDEMADRVKRLVRSQQELLANVSHELRTPLARIQVALDLAADDPAEARASFASIAGDLAELERLVRDILTAARLELSGNRASEASAVLRLEDVSLGSLLDDSARRFLAAHPHHRLERVGLEPSPTLSADPVLLRRAVDNLLDNAGKYSDPGSTVSLALQPRPQGVEVIVEDHGIGMDAHALAQVGTPFFRSDLSRTRTTGGIGLGLTLVKRIVEAHGGRLTMASEVGKGTRVALWLPCEQERTQTPASQERSRDSSGTEP